MHTALELLPLLALMLIGARLAGLVSQRLGMPAVFGELVLGRLRYAWSAEALGSSSPAAPRRWSDPVGCRVCGRWSTIEIVKGARVGNRSFHSWR